VLENGRWLLGAPRRLDSTSPLSEPPTRVEIGDWLYLETVTQRYGPPGDSHHLGDRPRESDC
jgi:hypothetical protein